MKHISFLALITLLLFWSTYNLVFNAYNWQNHDGNYHIQRGVAATQALKEHQFPLRWSSLLNYNCGLPIFNFFYPLMYYFQGILGLFGFDPVYIFKFVIVSFYLLGTYCAYFLIYKITNSKISGLISATLFALNPYYLQLLYIRANPEIITYSLIPLILLLIYRRHFFILFITLIAYFLSHNTTVMITFPIILVFIFYFQRNYPKSNKFLLITLIFSFLSSLFFIGPALLENRFIKLGKNIAADYQQHFPSFAQLFISPWGWGYSTSDLNDGMSFKFGYVQWAILLIAICISLTNNKKMLFLVFPLLVILFLTNRASTPIWDMIHSLWQLQYPWRLLGLANLIIVFIGGVVYLSLNVPFRYFYFLFVLIGSVFTNRNHIQVISTNIVPDFNRIGSTTIADELLPATATESCYVNSDRLSYFPDSYSIISNGQVESYHDCNGYLCLDSSNISSKSNFQWSYHSSRIESIFNIISTISAILWILFAFINRYKPL